MLRLVLLACGCTSKVAKPTLFARDVLYTWGMVTEAPLCPISAILAYLHRRGPSSGPLFIDTHGQPLTCSRLSSFIQSVWGSWLGCAVVPVMGALFKSRGWLPIVKAPGYFRHPTSILAMQLLNLEMFCHYKICKFHKSNYHSESFTSS